MHKNANHKQNARFVAKYITLHMKIVPKQCHEQQKCNYEDNPQYSCFSLIQD